MVTIQGWTSDCKGQLKVLAEQLPSHPTCPKGQVKFEPSKSFMLKAVVGTENPANEYQTKMWAGEFLVRTSENYPQC